MNSNDFINKIFPSPDQIPEQFRIETPIIQREYLINGELKTWNGPLGDVISPIYLEKDGEQHEVLIGSFPMLTEVEAYAALDSAVKAYDNGRGKWPTMTVAERIECVIDFTNHMKLKKDEVVKFMMWEIGKSLKDSEREFDRTVNYIYDTIEALKDLDRSSSKFQVEEGIIGQIRRSPLGVVLCMGPFNYPLNETFTTLIPALIMGNTVIFKPPRKGILLHHPLLEAFKNSFPAGVVNSIYGNGETVINPLMTSGKIDVLAFIGTSEVADKLKKLHPKPHRLRCILGLEAKNPAIILPDADLELAATECLSGALSYNGQRCTALKIIFIHKSIIKEFFDVFNTKFSALNLGMPWDENVDITPLPSEEKSEYLYRLIRDALLHGSGIINKKGGKYNKTMFNPCILYPVNDEMKIYREEQFGPVVPICVFEDVEEPLEYIRESNYGQQVSIFGSSSDVIAQLIDPLINQVCRINLNCQCQRGPDTFPFNGRKDSGEGTLSVSDALRVFSIRTIVASKSNELNKKINSEITREHKSNFLSTDYIF